MEQNLDFTFLTEDQVFGENKLDILKKYGTKASSTDFSILLGGCSSPDYYTKEGIGMKNRTSFWWIKPSSNNYDWILMIDSMGDKGKASFTYRNISARPVLSYSSISSLCSNEAINKSGILEVEFGEYPQYVVSEKIANTLEKLYFNKTIIQTGKSYTTDSVNSLTSPFEARAHIEYEYNGKKYIRFVGDNNCNGEILSNGQRIKYGEPYWVEVSPVKWLVDEKNDIALCKYLIFSGVRFNSDSYYNGNFKNTEIKKFMDTYLAKNIIPSNTYEKTIDIEDLTKLILNLKGLSEDTFEKLKNFNAEEYLKKISSENINIKDRKELISYLKNLKEDIRNQYTKVKNTVKESTYSKGVNVNDERSFSIKLTGLKDEILEEIKKLNQDKVKIEVEENKKVYRVKVKKIQK